MGPMVVAAVPLMLRHPMQAVVVVMVMAPLMRRYPTQMVRVVMVMVPVVRCHPSFMAVMRVMFGHPMRVVPAVVPPGGAVQVLDRF